MNVRKEPSGPEKPALPRGAAAALSFIAGLAVALMFSYLLFRIGFPSKPFIYVSF
jgi:hypothetical protein